MPAVQLLQQSLMMQIKTNKKQVLLLSDAETVHKHFRTVQLETVRNLNLWKKANGEPKQLNTSSEFLLVQSDMSESGQVDQLSGGGEGGDDDDDGVVSSLRRRRRLSSAAFGSPSSPSSTPSSIFSFLSVESAD